MSDKQRVVLVISEQDTRERFGRILADHYQVELCSSNLDAMAFLRGDLPALLLTSVILPDGTGLELCRRVKEDFETSDIKVIVLSSFRRSAKYLDDLRNKYKADGYLELPVLDQDLPKAVDAALNNRSFTQSKAAQQAPAKPASPPPPPPPPEPETNYTGPETEEESLELPDLEVPDLDVELDRPPEPFTEPALRPEATAEAEAPAETAAAETAWDAAEFEKLIDRSLEEKAAAEADHAALDTKPPATADETPPPAETIAEFAAAEPAAPTGTSEQEMTFTDQGRLGPMLLPELLLTMYERHAAGLLEIRAFEEQRDILLRDGLPVAIRSNFIADDALGQLLLTRGMIDAATLERSLAEAKSKNMKIGQIFVHHKILSQSDLDSMLHIQARRKINSAFRWREGAYRFAPGVHALPDAIDIEMDMLSILTAGISRHYDMTKLEDRLYLNRNAVVVRSEHPELTAEDLKLTRREWRVLDLIDGQRTLGEVIADTNLSFARTFQVLYLLLLFSVIHFKDGRKFYQVADAVAHRAHTETKRTVTAAAEGKKKTLDRDLPPAGSLADVKLPRYLFTLYQQRARGRLTLQQENQTQEVYIKDGMPVMILSTQPGPHALGNLLVEAGKISPAQRERLLTKAQNDQRRLGEVLLGEGLITPHELFEALMAQLETKLMALFTWQDGHYRFEDGLAAAGDMPPFNFDLTKLLFKGLQESLPVEQVEIQLRRYGQFPVMRAHPDVDLRKLLTDPRENKLIGYFDGETSLNDILRLSRRETGSSAVTLYSLLQLGLLVLVEE